MNLKDHRQHLKESLAKIREALPEDVRPSIEPHLRDIVEGDRDLREQLRETPIELERSRNEVQRLRAALDEQVATSADEVGRIRRELDAMRQREAAEKRKAVKERTADWASILHEQFCAPCPIAEHDAAMRELCVWFLVHLTYYVSHVAAASVPLDQSPAVQRKSHKLFREQLASLVNAHMAEMGASFRVDYRPSGEMGQSGGMR